MNMERNGAPVPRKYDREKALSDMARKEGNTVYSPFSDV